ncbi:MAG: U32 family peptidase [Bacteroidales bacterium]|jgi:putative protease|nr:U32 family peptidase [Bacteroidales bacterium]
MSHKIELLSPAKNLACGIEAVSHGADAIYIGPSQFGARIAAANLLTDVERLINYAHTYGVKVYITLNTILTDKELENAQKLIYQCYEIGADAIIVQDMGVLQLDLPPIALHASTQTNNRNLDRILFLESAGFQRIILARELSLTAIQHIKANSNIELEAFVHESLCVSYSGQCYMSHYGCGRSANRGDCAQYCRLPYTLSDANGNIVLENKHLLSLKDMDRSDAIEDMKKAGITSFKIEGRLKDMNYVKNITAYYRQKLDMLLEKDAIHVKRSSIGKSVFYFSPNPEKTFHRGKTDYFLYNRTPNMVQIDTPKSMGEIIGKVKNIAFNSFELTEADKLHHGDGLCFVDTKGGFNGFRVNRIENQKVYPAKKISIAKETLLYRNFDAAFNKCLKGKSAERKIAIDFTLTETDNNLILSITDEENIKINVDFKIEKTPAEKTELAKKQILTQLSKLGNTVFEARSINIQTKEIYFIPNSLLANSKREAIQQLLYKRNQLLPENFTPKKNKGPLIFPTTEVSYFENIMNNKAESFYCQAGVKQIAPAFEICIPKNPILMTTKYCIKHQLGWCPMEKSLQASNPPEPYSLQTGNNTFTLYFDCKECEMQITPFA